MSDHRRTVTRRAFVLPAWALVSSGVLVLVAAAWLAVLVVGGDDDPAAAASSANASTAAPTTPAPTESAEPTPEPDPTPSPEPDPTPSAEPTDPAPTGPDRSAVAVSVLNASRTQGLAATVGQRVTAAGWTVGAVGNWQGYSAANTVHFPQGREAEAHLLAEDLGIGAVAPSLTGMSTSRLTIVLVGPV